MLRTCWIPLLLLLALPLGAQVDSRLVMKTDITDALKEQEAKAELITVLDFSGSMTAVVWHKDYKTDSVMNKWIKDNPYKDGGRIRLSASNGTAFAHSLGTQTLTVGGVSRTAELRVKVPVIKPVKYGNEPVDFFDNRLSGVLVGPDGRVLPNVDQIRASLLPDGSINPSAPFFGSIGFSNGVIELSSGTDADAYGWYVGNATHARMTATFGAKRTVDLPLPWKSFKTGSIDHYTVRDANSGLDIRVDTIEEKGVGSGGGTIAGNSNVYGDANFNFNPDYLYWIFEGKNEKGDFFVPDSEKSKAWANGLPVSSRYQAIKKAVFETWVAVQHSVHWAYRFLDPDSEVKSSLSDANEVGGGNDRSLRLLAPFTGSLPVSITDLQKKGPWGGTPLTLALGNAYAQMINGAVFQSARKAEASPFGHCRRHYVILFTDGLANDGVNLNGGYLGNGDPFGANKGGTAAVKAFASGGLDLNNVNTARSFFNTWTLAGLAAHGGKPKSGTDTTPILNQTTSSGTGSPQAYAPFYIKGQDGTTFQPYHVIRTMTVGISLAGDTSDALSPTSSKKNLLLTAGYGDPGRDAWKTTTECDFIPRNAPSNQPGTRVDYYDAADEESLIASLKDALGAITEQVGATTVPGAPTVGLLTGDQLYLARYKPERTGPLWTGDLLSVSYRIVRGGRTRIFGKGGADLTGKVVDATNALWSAADLLGNRTNPADRKIYTYIGSKTASESGANRYAELNQSLTASECAFNEGNSDLIRYMNGGTDPTPDQATALKAQINWLRGEGRGAQGGGTGTRMGDSVSGGTVAIEYAPSVLKDAFPSAAAGSRTRLIFVGTNHGFIHAFAECSSGSAENKVAEIKELWAFMPKDFVAGAHAQLTTGSKHLFMADGPILGYLRDNPNKGLYRVVDDAQDKALIVFGLGKGGRSYYALDVSNPADPKLAWAVRPDDEGSGGDFTNNLIKGMGLSAALPGLAQINDKEAKKHVHLAFLPGGLSNSEIDTAMGAKLGRSLLAVEAETGKIYRGWDFINDAGLKGGFPNMGAVASSPVPVEVQPGSRMAQRVYFTDRGDADNGGGLYALGAGRTVVGTGSYTKLRWDSSDPKEWNAGDGNGSVRCIYKAPKGQVISVSPTPIRLESTYPGAPASAGKLRPDALGLAFGTGDRWDPRDRDTVNPEGVGGVGTHRVLVLFDRQDSSEFSGRDTGGIPEDKIKDVTTEGASSNVLNPAHDSYYLKSHDGFSVTLAKGVKKNATDPNETAAGASLYFYEKMVWDAVYLSNRRMHSLWFNVYDPSYGQTTSTDCMVGRTRTFRIADVFKPHFSEASLPSGTKGTSGVIWEFKGLAGPLVALGGDTVMGSGPLNKDGTTTVNNSGPSNPTDSLDPVGPRVRLRSWRIVR